VTAGQAQQAALAVDLALGEIDVNPHRSKGKHLFG